MPIKFTPPRFKPAGLLSRLSAARPPRPVTAVLAVQRKAVRLKDTAQQMQRHILPSPDAMPVQVKRFGAVKVAQQKQRGHFLVLQRAAAAEDAALTGPASSVLNRLMSETWQRINMPLASGAAVETSAAPAARPSRGQVIPPFTPPARGQVIPPFKPSEAAAPKSAAVQRTETAAPKPAPLPPGSRLYSRVEEFSASREAPKSEPALQRYPEMGGPPPVSTPPASPSARPREGRVVELPTTPSTEAAASFEPPPSESFSSPEDNLAADEAAPPEIEPVVQRAPEDAPPGHPAPVTQSGADIALPQADEPVSPAPSGGVEQSAKPPVETHPTLPAQAVQRAIQQPEAARPVVQPDLPRQPAQPQAESRTVPAASVDQASPAQVEAYAGPPAMPVQRAPLPIQPPESPVQPLPPGEESAPAEPEISPRIETRSGAPEMPVQRTPAAPPTHQPPAPSAPPDREFPSVRESKPAPTVLPVQPAIDQPVEPLEVAPESAVRPPATLDEEPGEPPVLLKPVTESVQRQPESSVPDAQPAAEAPADEPVQSLPVEAQPALPVASPPEPPEPMAPLAEQAEELPDYSITAQPDATGGEAALRRSASPPSAQPDATGGEAALRRIATPPSGQPDPSGGEAALRKVASPLPAQSAPPPPAPVQRSPLVNQSLLAPRTAVTDQASPPGPKPGLALPLRRPPARTGVIQRQISQTVARLRQPSYRIEQFVARPQVVQRAALPAAASQPGLEAPQQTAQPAAPTIPVAPPFGAPDGGEEVFSDLESRAVELTSSQVGRQPSIELLPTATAPLHLPASQPPLVQRLAARSAAAQQTPVAAHALAQQARALETKKTFVQRRVADSGVAPDVTARPLERTAPAPMAPTSLDAQQSVSPLPPLSTTGPAHRSSAPRMPLAAFSVSARAGSAVSTAGQVAPALITPTADIIGETIRRSPAMQPLAGAPQPGATPVERTVPPGIIDQRPEMVMPVTPLASAISRIQRIEENEPELEPEPPSSEAEQTAEPDIKDLARKVYPLVRRMLQIERERFLGRNY